MTQILKIDVKDNQQEEILLPPYKAVEHYYRQLQTKKKNWAPLSSCWDKEVSFMFPRSNAQEMTIAKEVCVTCPVSKECLKLALVNQEEYGIWGGYSSKEIQSTLKEVKSSSGNIWISWDENSDKLIDSIVDDMNQRFIKENGIDEENLNIILKKRLDEIENRLSNLKL
jgi:WhiB family redox-sensing transcriptional regulator